MAARTHSHIPPDTTEVNSENASLATFSIDGLSCSIVPRSQNGGKVKLPGSQVAIGHISVKERDYVIVQIERQEDSSLQKMAVNSLSKREIQIVVLVAEGKVNKQIADCLHISEWTVSTYLRRIFAKLGVDSRAAMVFKCSTFIKQNFK